MTASDIQRLRASFALADIKSLRRYLTTACGDKAAQKAAQRDLYAAIKRLDDAKGFRSVW